MIISHPLGAKNALIAESLNRRKTEAVKEVASMDLIEVMKQASGSNLELDQVMYQVESKWKEMKNHLYPDVVKEKANTFVQVVLFQ